VPIAPHTPGSGALIYLRSNGENNHCAAADSDLLEESAELEPDWLEEPEVPEESASELDFSCRPQPSSMTVNAPATSAILAAFESVLISIPSINKVRLNRCLTSGCGIDYSPYKVLVYSRAKQLPCSMLLSVEHVQLRA
jgi:hypothetical protein